MSIFELHSYHSGVTESRCVLRYSSLNLLKARRSSCTHQLLFIELLYATGIARRLQTYIRQSLRNLKLPLIMNLLQAQEYMLVNRSPKHASAAEPQLSSKLPRSTYPLRVILCPTRKPSVQVALDLFPWKIRVCRESVLDPRAGAGRCLLCVRDGLSALQWHDFDQ